MGYSSSRTAPAWVPSTGCSPSGADCSSVGPPRGHKSCQQTCFSVGSSLHGATGPQVLPGACSSAGFPRGHSVLRASTCSGVGSSTGCRWISAPPWTSMGCRGTACLTMVFTTGCRGISLCSGAWSTSSPSFFTDLGVCGVVPLTSSHSALSGCNCYSSVTSFPFLKYVIPEALPLLLIGSALGSSRSVLEPAGINFIGHRGSFQQLLTEATPGAPPATKTLPRKPNTGIFTPLYVRQELTSSQVHHRA